MFIRSTRPLRRPRPASAAAATSTTPIRRSPPFPAPSFRRISRAGTKSSIFAAATTIRSVTSSTAFRSIARSTTIPAARPERSASKSCKFTPAAARPARARAGLPDSSIRSSRPERFPATRRSAAASARRRTITTCSSRSGGATPDRHVLLLRRHRRLQSRFPLPRSVQRLESRRRLGLSGHRVQHDRIYLRRRLPDVRLQAAVKQHTGSTTDRTVRRSTIRSSSIRGSPVTSGCRAACTNDPGCYATITPAYSAYGVSNLADRENVVNLHFGIPHRHDAGRDDVQLLYNVVALQTQFYSSQNDLGPKSSRS